MINAGNGFTADQALDYNINKSQVMWINKIIVNSTTPSLIILGLAQWLGAANNRNKSHQRYLVSV